MAFFGGEKCLERSVAFFGEWRLSDFSGDKSAILSANQW